MAKVKNDLFTHPIGCGCSRCKKHAEAIQKGAELTRQYMRLQGQGKKEEAAKLMGEINELQEQQLKF